MDAKDKMVAAGKVALGAARIASGIATATGHGLIGSYCKSHHQMGVAARLAKSSVEGGSEMIRDGWRDLNR